MTNDPRISLLVPRTYVRTVKLALESKDLLDRSIKISTERNVDGALHCKAIRIVIPTTMHLESFEAYNIEQWPRGWTPVGKREEVLKILGLEDLASTVDVALSKHSKLDNKMFKHASPLLRALGDAVSQLPEDILSPLSIVPAMLIDTFSPTYSIYKPLLLLPPQTFSSLHWTRLLSEYPPKSSILKPVWRSLSKSLGATHIAVNAAIPLSTSSSTQGGTESKTTENVLRSPVNLTPMFGDYGPLPTQDLQCTPTNQDFENAFWVSTCQNGIHQVWAPLYTMFSRGNIREKTRLLKLPSIQACVSREQPSRNSAMAVDLYCGIGYFAFSYKKAGFNKVLCFELNPWSIEGLRRGARLNSWSTQIIVPNRDGSVDRRGLGTEARKADFLIFKQSNEEALAAIKELRSGVDIPSIRHVNCGFLPSSQGSWRTAIRLLDTQVSGWIHAHENVGFIETEKRMKEVVAEMQRYVDEWDVERNGENQHERRRNVVCEHVERVKTYAPRVLHVVFDIKVTVA